jgi:hypothetical protein
MSDALASCRKARPTLSDADRLRTAKVSAIRQNLWARVTSKFYRRDAGESVTSYVVIDAVTLECQNRDARFRTVGSLCPAADAVVAEDVEEHVEEADGKAKRKRGKRKRGRGGQGAKSGPDQQQAAPVAVQGRPSRVPRGNGQFQFPRNDNRPNLSLPGEQRRAEVDNRRAAPNGTRPTRWDQPPVQAPRRSPPWRDIKRSPERTLDHNRRRQRMPSPVDRRARPDDAKLLGFVATAFELIKERVPHQ